MLIRRVINSISIITAVFLIIAVIFLGFSWWSLLILGLVWLLITTYGVTNIRSGYFLNSLSSNPNIKEKKIAITFDDGPNSNTIKIL